MKKLIFEDLTYKVRGICYKAHNELGRYRNEKQYCDYIEQELKKEKLQYKREYILPKSFEGERIGRNRVDFIIENKLILEAKVVPSFSINIYRQCKRYLTSSNLRLLLLVNFFYEGVVIKRILNTSMNEGKNNNISKSA